MPHINFKAHGIALWVEYRTHSQYDDEPELIAITLDSDPEGVDIEPLVGSDIVEMAYAAINQDIIDLREYQRENAREMAYCCGEQASLSHFPD